MNDNPAQPDQTENEVDGSAEASLQQAEPEPQSDAGDLQHDDQADESPGDSYSWQASEFLHHQKPASWYLLLFGVVAVLIIVAVVTKQWFSIAVFIAMTAALGVYAGKEPRVLSYRLDPSGITIENKHYPYSQFRSFAVFNDLAWHAIDLDPAQRFMPRLTVMFDSDDLDTILAILSQELPRADRDLDLVERLTRKLKF
ncbi:MAG TPA: hypothetical protein VK963_00895 [Candidatus Saccharimonadales bacterium]|nr:hypothetical protein [Candidatus Saccharimonadales bacterium]